MKILKSLICLGLLFGSILTTFAHHCNLEHGNATHCKPCQCAPVDQPLTGIDCIPNNKITLVNSFSLGGPIQTVALNCNSNCMNPLLAVGGYKSECNEASLYLFEFDANTNNLTPITIDNPTPTACVYSVSWCCIDRVLYLAVGGSPDPDSGFSVWIYRYDSFTGQLKFIDGFKHGNIVYAVSWLCKGCFDSSRYLAIGGKKADNNQIRLLLFNTQTLELTHVSSRSFGATVFSLDWCIHHSQCPLLVAGGKTAKECQQQYNIRLYTISCSGKITPIASTYFLVSTR